MRREVENLRSEECEVKEPSKLLLYTVVERPRGLRCVVRSTVGCLISLRHISAELSEEAQASVSHTTGGPGKVTQRAMVP